MKHGIRLALIGLSACVLSGCATPPPPVFTSTWKAPDAKRITSLQGQKVLAFVLVSNVTMRCKAENALASELTLQGAVGIAGYTIIPDITEKARAKDVEQKSGAAGVVTIRIIGHTQKTGAIQPKYTDLSSWGAYWESEWDHAWQPPMINSYSFVTVETRVYSLTQNKLLWAGRSEPTDPFKVDESIGVIMRAAVDGMKKSGVM